MRFHHTIGIELTGVPRDGALDDVLPGEGWGSTFRRQQRLVRVLKKATGCSTTHCDMHCIEVPSRKLRTLAATKRWFIRVRTAMHKYGLRAKHPDVVCGGGHIHVGIQDKLLREYTARHVNRCYFLPWVFSEPDEKGSCDNCRNDIDITYGFTKDNSVCCTPLETVELRFFESPLNWAEQKDHIDFALAYVKYVEKLYRDGVKHTRLTRQLHRITPQQAITAFKKLLGALNLPYSRYEKYVNRNLLPRWQAGRRRR